MAEPTVTLYVRIPPALRKQLDQVVARERSSLQRVVTDLLSSALDESSSKRR